MGRTKALLARDGPLPRHVCAWTCRHRTAASWEPALAGLVTRGIPVVVAEGAADPVPVPGRAAALARDAAGVSHVVHPTADLGLPITDPGWCTAAIAELWRQPSAAPARLPTA